MDRNAGPSSEVDLSTTEKDDAAEQKAPAAEPKRHLLREAALDYAARGIPVFPCNPKNKRPLVGRDKDSNGTPIPGTGGFHIATCDPIIVHQWWTQWPTAMIGIPTGPTSSIDVIDIDIKYNGFAAIPDWKERSNVIVRTPSNGAHLYCKSDGSITNTASGIGPGVDTRGRGGYVIVPPSRSATGEYRFERGSEKDFDLLPPFPEDLRARLVGRGPPSTDRKPLAADHDTQHAANSDLEADPTLVAAALAAILVNRLPNLTPHRRPILTLLSDGFGR